MTNEVLTIREGVAELASRFSSISLSTRAKVLALFITIGALFRFVLLGNTPAPFVDELLAAIDIRSTLRSGVHYTGLPVDLLGKITPVLDGRTFTHFLIGDSIGNFRLTSAILGTATIYVVYRICLELFDATTGLWAAASLAIMPWAIYYSRVDIPASEYVFGTSACLYFVISAIRKESAAAAFLGSISAAATIYIYPTALVSTPLLVMVTLLVLFRDTRSFPLRKAVPIAAITSMLLLPYAWEHLVASGSKATASLNPIITGRLIWNQKFSFAEQTHLFFSNWASFLSPQFLFFSGDPNTRQSIQTMGEVGWCISILGICGIVACLRRRSRADLLLLTWLLVYPIADALTYQNASSNSVVGATGQIPWACLAATGAMSILVGVRHQNKPIFAALIFVALSTQCFAFGLIYFGSYNAHYGFDFEPSNEYTKAVDAIENAKLEGVPISNHSGYLRNLVFDYYSNYHLQVTSWYTSCNRLPIDVVHYTISPRIFVLSETTAYDGNLSCISALSLIRTDLNDLRSAGWKLRVLANYANSPGSRYRTSVILATRTIPSASGVSRGSG